MQKLTTIFGLVMAVLIIAAMDRISEPSYADGGGMSANEKSDREYEIGYRLGTCLVQDGCQVFIGAIRNVGSPEQAAGTGAAKTVIYKQVDLAIEEWLWGARAAQVAEVTLNSAERPAMTRVANGPWSAWNGVDLNLDGKLLVALWGEKAQRPKWEGNPEKVAMVTSETDSFAALKEVLQTHDQYELSSEAVVNGVRQLDISKNFLVGYTIAYLKNREEIRNVDGAALAFSLILDNANLPESIRVVSSVRLESNCYRLSDSARKVAVQSLITAGVSENQPIAEAAINALVRLAQERMVDVRSSLSPDNRRLLIERYQMLKSRGQVQSEHSEFDAQLGVKSP
jgi:hypothetical protein